jgi:hypothetical protein
MATKIILKRSSDTSASGIPNPSILDYGELALNYGTGTLYYKKADNTLGSITSSAGGVSQTTAQDLAIQMAIALG